MSLYNYVDTPNSNLICCICRTPFVDPTTTMGCAHTFCTACIRVALQHAPQCPIDRSTLGPADLGPASPIVRSLVDELVVECVHRAAGCAHTCQRQALASHIRDDCVYTEVPCPRACGAEVCRSDMPAHVCEGVENEGTTEEEDAGEDKATTSADTGPRTTCPTCSRTIPTPAPTETHPHQLAHLTQLSAQNMLLRQRVEHLESALQQMRRELGAVRHALGPWDRGSSLLPSTGTAEGHRPRPARSASGSGSGLDVPAGAADRPSYGHAPEMAPLFPGDAAAPAPELPPPFAPHALPFPAHMHAYAPPVAPLHLSGTLEGALHGLRESVVGLAAGVESLGRRQDIEAVRVGEEMGGLRAGVYGLRMQVHAIMMDRNALLTGRDGVGDHGHARVYYPQAQAQQGPASITKL